MKAFNTVLKILAALAAIAGVIYVIATYGEMITAWAKQLLEKFNCCCCGCGCDCDCQCECCEEVVAEEVVEADEKDFEG